MVTISKRSQDDGTVYEIEDFSAYATELHQRNMPVPLVQYSVFIPHQAEQDLQASCNELENQIALFFRIGPSSGIPYRMSDG